MSRSPVHWSLMVHQKEILDKLVLELCSELMTEVWLAFIFWGVNVFCFFSSLTWVSGQICRLSEGVGIATCNVAEYRGIILGLKYAVVKGYDTIRVQGDSKLVCMQVWTINFFLDLYKFHDTFLLCGFSGPFCLANAKRFLIHDMVFFPFKNLNDLVYEIQMYLLSVLHLMLFSH